MLGMKINRNNIRNILNNVKSHLHNGYHNTKHFLNHVDSGVRTAKQLYTIVEPLIQAYAGNHNHKQIHDTLIKGLSGYEKLRKGVIEGHDEAVHHVNNVKKGLINLGLN